MKLKAKMIAAGSYDLTVTDEDGTCRYFTVRRLTADDTEWSVGEWRLWESNDEHCLPDEWCGDYRTLLQAKMAASGI